VIIAAAVTALLSLLYNRAARVVGGVGIEFED
jgi:hypothetical protein